MNCRPAQNRQHNLSKPLMQTSKENIDNIIRLAFIALIVIWSVTILAPFVSILVWAAIIAISSYPAFLWISGRVGGRSGWAAAILVLFLLLVILIPIALSLPGFADSVRSLAVEFKNDTLAVPAAPEKVKQWPLVGVPVYELWSKASTNFAALFQQFKPQLQSAGVDVLGLIAAVGFFIMQFFIATIVAGVMLAHHQGGTKLARKFADKVASDSASRYLALIENTVRGVTNGVIGVAIVQAILAGIGFVAIGIPAAAFWAFCCLVLATLQITISIIVIPMAIYVFSNHELLPAILFVAWNIPIMTLDNIVKPFLMGMGVDAPMLVIFFGALGGFISFGLLGLFVGAVVLVIAYDLLMLWLGNEADIQADSESQADD